MPKKYGMMHVLNHPRMNKKNRKKESVGRVFLELHSRININDNSLHWTT